MEIFLIMYKLWKYSQSCTDSSFTEFILDSHWQSISCFCFKRKKPVMKKTFFLSRPNKRKENKMCVLENKYPSKLLKATEQKLIVERRKSCKEALHNYYGEVTSGLTFILRGLDNFRLFHRLTKHGRCHGKCRPMQALYAIKLPCSEKL